VTTRRAFIRTLAGALLTPPLAVEAQEAGKPVRIGWISVTSPVRGPEQQRPVVEHHLRQSRWNPHFELRYAEGDLDRLAVMAEELARARLAVIDAPDTQGALAAKNATATIPIVMSSGDPSGPDSSPRSPSLEETSLGCQSPSTTASPASGSSCCVTPDPSAASRWSGIRRRPGPPGASA
jgi:putative tryptophan/tyrosine transport system substrate-binding protein